VFFQFWFLLLFKVANSQTNYTDIKEFEVIPVFSEEFNNNTNKWNLSDLYPVYSKIENSRLIIRTEDFPNILLHNIRFNPDKDFQIEFSMKQLQGDSTQLASFVYGFSNENGNGYGFITAERNVVLSVIKRKTPEIQQKTFVEKSYNEIFNKFTVRKIKNKLYFYINEVLVFTESSSDFDTSMMGWYIPANVVFAFDYFNVVYLKPVKKTKSKD